MEIKKGIYKQTTADTCLPSCLLMILEDKGIVKSNQKLEIEILVEGDKINKYNRTFGHLFYVCKKYGLYADYYSFSQYYIKVAKEIVKKFQYNNINVKKADINSHIVKKLIKSGYLVVSIDDFALRKELHFPHYVVLDKYVNNKFELIDPWDGKLFYLNAKELDNAVSLLNNLLYLKELLIIK